MILRRTTAKDGSVAVAGNNEGTIVNVQAADGATVRVRVDKQLPQKLPSFLGKLVAAIANDDLATFGAHSGTVPPAVEEKLQLHCISSADVFVDDYLRYVAVLENAFRGVEQHNPAARQLVRRVARNHYELALKKLCPSASPPRETRLRIAQANAHALVESVVKGMVSVYAESAGKEAVEMEIVDLAVSLVVADAIVECDVLERP